MKLTKAALRRMEIESDPIRKARSLKVKRNKEKDKAAKAKLIAEVNLLVGEELQSEPDFKFDKPRSLRELDVAWPLLMIFVEIQGRGQGHYGFDETEKDHAKLADATLKGWTGFLASHKQVKNGTAAGWVAEYIKGEGRRA